MTIEQIMGEISKDESSMITNSPSNRGEMTMTNILDVSVSETGNEVINNQYTLLNLLGTGSFAEVRRAKCLKSGNYFVTNLTFLTSRPLKLSV